MEFDWFLRGRSTAIGGASATSGPEPEPGTELGLAPDQPIPAATAPVESPALAPAAPVSAAAADPAREEALD
ncbi:MAG: hypothetical protein WBM08_06605, partial [Prochlorococcaceae cyanobacterium]